MEHLEPEQVISLRTQMLSLAVQAYDKGQTQGKRDPIELAELYMSYVLGTMKE